MQTLEARNDRLPPPPGYAATSRRGRPNPAKEKIFCVLDVPQRAKGSGESRLVTPSHTWSRLKNWFMRYHASQYLEETYEAGRWPAIFLRLDPRAALVPRLPWAGMRQAVGLRYGDLAGLSRQRGRTALAAFAVKRGQG
jgi:hypothetical protein